MNVIKKLNPFQNKITKASDDETKLVGGYIPATMAERLRLLSIYYEKSLQLIIKESLENWYASYGNPDKSIIEELSDRAVAEWNRRKKENKMTQKQYLGYLKELEERLEKKKLSSDNIQAILIRIEDKIAEERENEKNQ